MGKKTALGYVLDDDGTLIDAFIQCDTTAAPAPTVVELEIVRIVKEHRELKAEMEAAKNGYQIISILMDMQRACPVGCMTAIHIETKDRDPVVFSWEFKVKGKRYVVEKRISWIELQYSRGTIDHREVTEKIKATAANERN